MADIDDMPADIDVILEEAHRVREKALRMREKAQAMTEKLGLAPSAQDGATGNAGETHDESTPLGR